jgi:hypothetical protein
MAWDDDRQRVAARRRAGRANARRAPDARREIAVCGSLAERNRRDGVPHLVLERGAGRRERNRERRARAGEVLGDLRTRSHEDRIVASALPRAGTSRLVALPFEPRARERFAIARQQHRAKRRRQEIETDGLHAAFLQR